MRRESHVRFCERLEGETPSCLLSGVHAEKFREEMRWIAEPKVNGVYPGLP
jgi:hypothetical protein